jgi:hypothetical protein
MSRRVRVVKEIGWESDQIPLAQDSLRGKKSPPLRVLLQNYKVEGLQP